jgi:DNA-binding MarR family transcriptional regulator
MNVLVRELLPSQPIRMSPSTLRPFSNRLSSRPRRTLIDEMGTAMRLFIAHAVFYQDAVASWAGMHSTDLQCLGLLMLDGPMTPRELAHRTGLTAGGAITGVVDRLEAAGLVHRVRDEIDRRRVLVTPDAEAILHRVGPVYARVGARWNAYLDTLSDEQIALATEIITQATTINREEVESLRGRSAE